MIFAKSFTKVFKVWSKFPGVLVRDRTRMIADQTSGSVLTYDVCTLHSTAQHSTALRPPCCRERLVRSSNHAAYHRAPRDAMARFWALAYTSTAHCGHRPTLPSFLKSQADLHWLGDSIDFCIPVDPTVTTPTDLSLQLEAHDRTQD
ncbi:1,3-beta-glucanosyltransferase [Pseudozyma hubeiensis SY62]|uniref:1,3-beta-glucanosyltransferase n=1 Tax=Pseudozyma hubeiensis (strain SY62) TaxID=1305764 RepID=R9P9J5_PSEHS|nr:1,3-beta-glucanosyltransferase [Pseudozyma hubeiensis SY62]GAC98063.1 1,3-beta-glucanosyltransferase [Pseudozyma hubeiensis SY62]